MPARNYIELIEKATRVLEVMAHGEGGKSLKEIAEEAKLVKSSTFRILFTLRELGYVEQDSERGTYRLSLKIVSLSRGAMAKATLPNIARPFMEELRDKTGESVWLAERRAHSVLLVDEAESSHPIRLLLRVGDLSPLHATAVGKVVAAHMDEEELEEALGERKLTKFTSRTITSRSELKEHLAGIRRDGYALNDEETIRGAIVTGAPIFDANGRVCAALSVAITTSRASEDERFAIIAGVRDCAGRITQALREISFESVSTWGRLREVVATG